MRTPLSHSCAPLFLPSKELVVQKGWRLPEYTVTQESGPAHRKEFTMTCRVERFIEIGATPWTIQSLEFSGPEYWSE